MTPTDKQAVERLKPTRRRHKKCAPKRFDWISVLGLAGIVVLVIITAIYSHNH